MAVYFMLTELSALLVVPSRPRLGQDLLNNSQVSTSKKV